ncbi:MAG: hypothetical protein Q4A07_02735 [Coriobacteriales bacterium]|nr:hypothetical protein [Coriobacteriales bacterium]
MVVAEAVALLFLGLFSGIMATMFDVLFVGAASFVSHFSLWVLLNAILAVHVDSRIKAIWWAIPFNLGYIESYFITTVASYESFSKSLIVPLALVGVISPLLSYGLWTAKREKNAYGQALSLLIVVGTLISSFLLNGTVSIYAIVVCLLLAFVLLKMPVHRLKISRSKRKPAEAQEVAQVEQESPGAARAARPRIALSGKADASREPTRPTRRAKSEKKEATRKVRRGLPLVRRTKKDERNQQDVDRERRRTTRTKHRNGQDQPQSDSSAPNATPSNGMSTLGNARVARRSTRSSARYR